MPVNKLTEHVTRAAETSNVNSTPPVTKTIDGATVTKMSQPLTESPPRAGARGRLDLQRDLMHGRRMIAKNLGGGYVRTQVAHSPKFRYPPLDILVTSDPSNDKGSDLTQGLIKV